MRTGPMKFASFLFFHAILYYTVLSYTMLYYTIPYHTMAAEGPSSKAEHRFETDSKQVPWGKGEKDFEKRVKSAWNCWKGTPADTKSTKVLIWKLCLVNVCISIKHDKWMNNKWMNNMSTNGKWMIPVSVKKTPLTRIRHVGKSAFKAPKSGAGEQFLLQSCRARAHVKGVFFHRHGVSSV